MNRWPSLSITMPWEPFGCQSTDCTVSCPRKGRATPIASPYGGLLYVEVVNWNAYEIQYRATRVKLSVDGAIQAPWIALDYESSLQYTEEELSHQKDILRFPRSTSLSGYDASVPWKERVTQCEAPWGELEGNFVILSLPRECLESVRDPGKSYIYINVPLLVSLIINVL